MVNVGSSVLGDYNPIFYANEALQHLEKALGMAARVHRGYDAERRSFGKGDTINIRTPQTFTVQNAPGTKEGLETETTSLVLNQWKTVKFGLRDDELAFTGERLINDHIRPAAYALADNIDLALVGLWKDVAYQSAWAGSDVVADITNARKAMFDNAVPLDAGLMHMMLDSTGEQQALSSSAFTQQQGAGDLGISSQVRGSLGQKFGFELFANQNVASSTAGGADVAGALTADVAVGATTIAVDGFGTIETQYAGTIVTIADEAYTLAADITFVAGAGTMTLSSKIRVAALENVAVALTAIDAKSEQLAFHRNAFALAMAPLPENGNQLGANVATVSDPITGLSLRSRMYYDGDASETIVALDILYGFKTLNPKLAMRMRR